MKRTTILLILAVMFSTSMVWAEEDVLIYPGDKKYKTIQDAIDDFDTHQKTIIELPPGEYKLTQPLILRDGMTLRGQDTALTVLRPDDGVENLTLIKLSQINSATIRNLTFRDALVGINLTDNFSSSFKIRNNVFYLGVSPEGTQMSVAVELSDTVSLPDVQFNTFYKNSIAISSTADVFGTVKNNIFSNNEFYTDNLVSSHFSYNCFVKNTNEINKDDPTPFLVFADDAKFSYIDETKKIFDFHLQANSPCKDQGSVDGNTPDRFVDEKESTENIPDFGAYGGPDRDPYPFSVTLKKVEASLVDDGTYTLTVIWLPSKDFMMAATGSHYKLDFGTESGKYDLSFSESLASPYTITEDLVDKEANAGFYTTNIAGFNIAAQSIGTPVISSTVAANQRLEVTWSAVENASAYHLTYSRNDDGSDSKTIENIKGTHYLIEGLENGVAYSVSVAAIFQPTFYFQMRAVEGLSGSNFESHDNSKLEYSIPLGDDIVSAPSVSAMATPDFVRAYPALPNEGCFIATATFGSYEAYEVQFLRDFRDRFLLTNKPGRHFVNWYYRYGPIAATWINRAPEFKPLVQAVLYPYVGISRMFLSFGSVASGLILSILYFVLTLFMFRLTKPLLTGRAHD
ncbi:MAG: hypothetical protein OEZ43_03090 [Gammaproteobacteria bacterium]|nr:hypothetical protein [Gammaproteobacteria bacterium]